MDEEELEDAALLPTLRQVADLRHGEGCDRLYCELHAELLRVREGNVALRSGSTCNCERKESAWALRSGWRSLLLLLPPLSHPQLFLPRPELSPLGSRGRGVEKRRTWRSFDQHHQEEVERTLGRVKEALNSSPREE